MIYSELLGVPTTIESGASDKIVNFYDENSRMEYGTGNDYGVIQHAFDAEGGDCTVYMKKFDSGEE